MQNNKNSLIELRLIALRLQMCCNSDECCQGFHFGGTLFYGQISFMFLIAICLFLSAFNISI